MITLGYHCERIRDPKDVISFEKKITGHRQFAPYFSESISKTYNDLVNYLHPGTPEDGCMILALIVTAPGMQLSHEDIPTLAGLVQSAVRDDRIPERYILSCTVHISDQGTACLILFFPMEQGKRVPNANTWLHGIHKSLPSKELESKLESAIASKFPDVLVTKRQEKAISTADGYMPALINYQPEPYRKEYDTEQYYKTLDPDAHTQTILPFDEIQRISDEALRYFTTGPEHLYFERSQRPGTEITQEMFLGKVRDYVKKYHPMVEKMDMDTIIRRIQRAIYGNYILEPLIDADEISDIMVLAPDKIRVKIGNERFTSNLKFLSVNDYERFVYSLCVRNGIGAVVDDPAKHAINVFSDITSNPKFRMRMNLTTPYIDDVSYPQLHIRKIANEKRDFDYLKKAGMLDDTIANYLIDKARNGKGMIFTGKGASGKTTLMNALLDKIPFDKSGLVIQESQELFSKVHPHLIFEHIAENSDNPDLNYGLQDLARNGLLTDLDYFIIGEVKGAEAKYFINAADTGHRCWCSVHSPSSTDAIDKLADYVMYETKYSKEEATYMLKDLGTVIFMQNFKVYEISEISGYDYKTKSLIYTPVYKRPVIENAN